MTALLQCERIAAATAFSGILLTPSVAYADNCGSLSDCYGVIAAAVLAAIAISAVVALIAVFPEIIGGVPSLLEAGALGSLMNALNHVFGDPGHGLDQLVSEFGSEANALVAVQSATQDAVESQGIQDFLGAFSQQVAVGSQIVTVRGKVIDGMVRIGTMFVR